MFDQPPPPQTHRILHLLSNRGPLTSEEAARKNQLQRGFEGEMKFYTLLQEKLHVPNIPLYGLQLSHGMNEFQIDCLLLFNHEIYLLEVKHYHGDFIVQDDRWYYAATKDEINSPLDQLTRSEMLLKAFLKNEM